MSQYDMQAKVGSGFTIAGRLRDELRQPLDLSAAQAVRLRVRKVRTTGAAALSVDMTIVNQAAPVGHPDRGKVTYDVTGTQSSALGAGDWELEVEVDWGDGSPTIAPGWGNRLLRLNESLVA